MIDRVELFSDQDVSEFQIEDEHVEKFLKDENFGIKLHKQRKTRIHLAYSGEVLVGYLAMYNGSIQGRHFTSDEFRSKEKIPAIFLGRIGRDLHYEKSEIGKELVQIAINLALRVSNLSGCRFLVIEAYEEHAKTKWEDRYGFRPVDKKERKRSSERSTSKEEVFNIIMVLDLCAYQNQKE